MKMKRFSVLTLLIAALLSIVSSNLAAQVKGNIVWAEYQIPRPAHKEKYEEARKERAKWHKEKGGTLPVYVWEVLTGERTGHYLIATSAKDWSAFDSSPVSIEQAYSRFGQESSEHVVRVRSFFLDQLIEVSRSSEDKSPAPLAVLRYFKISYGKWGEFYNLLRKFKEAAEFGEWPVHYSWYSVNNGADEPMFVEAIPKSNWADMEPPQKAPLQLITELFGPEDTILITNLMHEIIEKETSEVLRYRPDLSYVPEGSR